MMNKIQGMVLGILVLELSSCTVYEEHMSPTYQIEGYDNSQLYPQMEYQTSNWDYKNQVSEPVTVPDSYHVGAYHAPVSFKERDQNWVSSQNPQGYTIEIADDEKASQVAQKLYKTPKNERMAEVKYQRNGKAYYKGIYGTYDNAQEAQKALDALPEDIKKGAGIKSWGTIQSNLTE